MVGHLAAGHRYVGNRDKSRQIVNQRLIPLLERLPYSPELRPAYVHVYQMHLEDQKDLAKATTWQRALEEQATRFLDLRAVGGAQFLAGNLLYCTGDLRGAISRYQGAQRFYTRIGDAKHTAWCLVCLAETYLMLGDILSAAKHAFAGLEIVEGLGTIVEHFVPYASIAEISLCQGKWERAAQFCEKELQFWRDAGHEGREARAALRLGRLHLATRRKEEAKLQFEQALALIKSDSSGSPADLLVATLSSLDEVLNDPEAFRVFCRRLREDRPEIGDSEFINWYLEHAIQGDFPQRVAKDDFLGPLPSEWIWQDPFGDCSLRVQDRLEIYAANGRDLAVAVEREAVRINRSAPRMLRGARGDFAAQTICTPVSVSVSDPADVPPAIGGLLLWKDDENWLRLDVGRWGPDQIYFGCCVGNQGTPIGRGYLDAVRDKLDVSGRAFLRLERVGPRVRALCSAD